jgi:chloramphenicol 3-O-phosphotransferase
VPAIQAAADRGIPVHVLMNNNRSNYAVVNGFDMANLLGVRTPRPPEPILRRMAERDGDLPGWVRGAAEPPAPPAAEGSRQQAPGPVVAQSEQLHLDV